MSEHLQTIRGSHKHHDTSHHAHKKLTAARKKAATSSLLVCKQQTKGSGAELSAVTCTLSPTTSERKQTQLLFNPPRDVKASSTRRLPGGTSAYTPRSAPSPSQHSPASQRPQPRLVTATALARVLWGGGARGGPGEAAMGSCRLLTPQGPCSRLLLRTARPLRVQAAGAAFSGCSSKVAADPAANLGDPLRHRGG